MIIELAGRLFLRGYSINKLKDKKIKKIYYDKNLINNIKN